MWPLCAAHPACASMPGCWFEGTSRAARTCSAAQDGRLHAAPSLAATGQWRGQAAHSWTLSTSDSSDGLSRRASVFQELRAFAAHSRGQPLRQRLARDADGVPLTAVQKDCGAAVQYWVRLQRRRSPKEHQVEQQTPQFSARNL